VSALDTFLSLAFFLQTLRIAVPYVLAALGGTFAERSGVINLSLEGVLTGGAVAAALGSELAGVPGGVVIGVAGGLVTSVIYGIVVLHFGADQIVAGVALNLLMLGISRYLLKLVWGSASSTPTLAGLSLLGDEIFIVATIALVALSHRVMTHTRYGLRVRAVGEHPEAADSLGVSVLRVRWIALVVSGALAGLGGAFLALDNHGYVDRMSGGRGYIALAAMIFGRWRPVPVAAAAFGFAVIDAVEVNLQGTTTVVPRELLQVLPYVVTIFALAGAVGRARSPAALGKRWI
jgi:simple sugar transport system permease protein